MFWWRATESFYDSGVTTQVILLSLDTLSLLVSSPSDPASTNDCGKASWLEDNKTRIRKSAEARMDKCGLATMREKDTAGGGLRKGADVEKRVRTWCQWISKFTLHEFQVRSSIFFWKHELESKDMKIVEQHGLKAWMFFLRHDFFRWQHESCFFWSMNVWNHESEYDGMKLVVKHGMKCKHGIYFEA